MLDVTVLKSPVVTHSPLHTSASKITTTTGNKLPVALLRGDAECKSRDLREAESAITCPLSHCSVCVCGGHEMQRHQLPEMRTQDRNSFSK